MQQKLVACKSCGSQVAKSAKACPNCGAKQNQGIYSICAIILVLTLFFCAFILFAPNNEPAINNEQAAQAVSVSAADLSKAYSDNKVNADNLYKGKTLAVTGTIVNITKDIISGAPCISFDSGDVLSPIQCFFPKADENSEALAALHNNQAVTITGICSGAPVLNIQLTDCVLK